MKYYIVDAFARHCFEGNPAGICILDEWIEESLMQQIAQENNLSETAFVVKEGEFYHIRWFTPQYEIDLCGHATLATAFIIHQFIEPSLKEIIFISKSGVLKVRVENDNFILDFPTRMPKPIEVDKKVEDILGVMVKEAYLSRDLMLVIESQGGKTGEQVIAELLPDFSRMALYEIGDGMIVTAQGDNSDFVSRCFYPKCGVNEDPVTGSAYCNLIPYWAERLGKNKLLAKQISSRGGVLQCTLDNQRVYIGGSAVLYMEGTIKLNNIK